MPPALRLLFGLFLAISAFLPVISSAVEEFIVEGSVRGPSAPLQRYPGPDEYVLPAQLIRFTWSAWESGKNGKSRAGVPRTERHMEDELRGYEPDFYQFELLNSEGEILWKTQTKKNYIEVLDVPPSSYRRLECGTYFWQMRSAVNKYSNRNTNISDVGILGPPSKTRFFISKNALIYKNQPKLEIGLGVFPGFFYSTTHSGASAARSQAHGPNLGGSLFLRGWFSRHWGMQVDSAFYRYQAPLIYGIFAQGNLAALWRTQLSASPTGIVKGYGTWLALGLGVNVRQELQLESLTERNTPWSAGPHFRFILAHDWTAFTGGFIDLSFYAPLSTFPGGGTRRNDDINATHTTPFSVDLTTLAFRTFSGGMRLGLGLRGAIWQNKYAQLDGTTSTQTFMFGPYGQMSIVF